MRDIIETETADPPPWTLAVKKRAIVPTLLTLGNAVCGLAAIAYASKIGKAGTSPVDDHTFMAWSGWLIVAAMVFDALDGFFARLFKAAGDFGAELDSLCDAVSFGAAPAFLLLQLGPGRDQPFLHQVLAAVATLYMMCAILRLARFNVEKVEGSKRFKGLPSPAAAGCIASLAIACAALPNWSKLNTPFAESMLESWATLGSAFVGLLMVSNVAYPHLTKQMIKGKRSPWWIVAALLGAVLVREFILVVIFWGYAVSFLVRAVMVRAARNRAYSNDVIPH